MIKYAKLCLNDLGKSWLECIVAEPKDPTFYKYRMSLAEAKMFCFCYEEDGVVGWRLPTKDEAINNDELAGCWHQGDLDSEYEWVTSGTYFVRPVKGVNDVND